MVLPAYSSSTDFSTFSCRRISSSSSFVMAFLFFRVPENESATRTAEHLSLLIHRRGDVEGNVCITLNALHTYSSFSFFNFSKMSFNTI